MSVPPHLRDLQRCLFAATKIANTVHRLEYISNLYHSIERDKLIPEHPPVNRAVMKEREPEFFKLEETLDQVLDESARRLIQKLKVQAVADNNGPDEPIDLCFEHRPKNWEILKKRIAEVDESIESGKFFSDRRTTNILLEHVRTSLQEDVF